MNAEQTIRFIEQHGMVLLAGKGAVPRLTEAIAGEPINGSWWGHAKGKEIFSVLQHVSECEDVLFCKLLGGKVTLVHRRLWPALVKMAHRLPTARLARVYQEHTPSGRHRNREITWPQWVPQDCMTKAAALTEEDASRLLQLEMLTDQLC